MLSTWLLLARLFTASFVLVSKLIFVYLLHSGVVTKLVSGILFSISVAFLFKQALVAKLVMSGILLSISVAFVFKAAFVARLVIPGSDTR